MSDDTGMLDASAPRPTLLVLASTYPRRAGDHEPGFVHELCKRLVQHFRVIAVVPDAADADASGEFDGVEVVRYRYAPRALQTLVHGGGIVANLRRSRWKGLLLLGFMLGQYVAARRVLRMRKIDVIHAHWLLPQGLIARRLARLHKIPYVVTSHGGDLFSLRGRLPTWLKQKVAGDCAAMTVVSSAMRDEAARIGLRPPRIDVLPMGVDLQDRFAPDAQTQRVADELLFVGRLVPKKGLTHLLNALPAVIAQRPWVRLIIAGFGPENASLKAQAGRLGIAERIEFKGATPQADLPALYRRASLFVAPFVQDVNGDQEGLGLVVVEAIGCLCPVIASDLPALRDVFGNDSTGLVEPGNADALSAAVLRVLENPVGACERAEVLRQEILAKFDWDGVAERYGILLHKTATTAWAF